MRRIETTGTVDMPISLMASVMTSVPEASKDWARQYHTMLVLGSLLEQRLRLTRDRLVHQYVGSGSDGKLAAKYLVLGEAVSAAAAYDLYRAGQIANFLSQHEPEFESGILIELARHVLSLRRDDGYYGYYPDERHFISINTDRDYDLGHNHDMAKQECDALLQRHLLI